ncbi:hypothetical protein OIU78_000825 [Salix suchowensis]|nr:hypothetical protein OIU78_000825 [Salix suchowensis]
MVHVPEFHLGKNLLDNGMTKLLITLVLIVLAPMIPLYILNISSPIWLPSKISESRKCDIFRGKWIPYQDTPYYNNATCREISDQQNCMKFGRPDTDFLKWKWKPDECELPRFDSEQFLELVRGKSMAFIGDSLGRNQMQSLQCLLSRVVYPEDIVSYTEDARFKRWFYVNYNFTLASSWAPHLVRTIDTDPDGPTYNRLLNLYLDEADHAWAARVETYDYVIISAGRWFYGPQVFYENGKAVGCHLCLKNTIKNLTMFYGYRKAFRTSFKTLISLARFSGVTFLRTLSPAHFENGEWNKGGNCVRTRPVSKGENENGRG